MRLKKVLVIDDDLITRKMIVKNVEGLGYTAIQSSNGRHGWETLWENPDVSLVITDMMMPDMDGRELIRVLRGNQTFTGLPIVIMSGVSSPSEVADLLELGNATFCAKPLNVEDLKKCLAEMLEARGQNHSHH